jgi:hypothetical protein
METSTLQPHQDGEPTSSQTKKPATTVRKKQVAENIELARIQLAHEIDLEKNIHQENRKVLISIGIGTLLFLLIVLGFTAWCITMGKEQFVIEFLKYSLYPLSAGGGFWAGRVSRSSHSEQPD